MTKDQKERLNKLQERYDHFLTVAFQELQRSPDTNGWGYDAIARQAATAAEALMYHRSKSTDFLRALNVED